MGKKIRIHPDMVGEISEEYKTSKTNVYTALSYYNNSDLALKIRQRAKEKLLEEAKKITEDQKNNDAN